MQHRFGKDENEWIDLVWTWVHAELKPKQRVFVPAGNTPAPIYRAWSQRPQDDLLKSLTFVQIDDVLTGPMKDHFRDFFVTEMKPFLSQFEWINSGEQCADAAILGVGVNGHVAFHEPGIHKTLFSGCVPLSEETKRYLSLTEPTWGLTYGVGAFLACKKILVIARGPVKQKVIDQALAGADLPIAAILRHPDVTLITSG